MSEKEQPNPQAKLREPFAAEQIGKLPRITCKACRDSSSKNCGQHQKSKCGECGNWITSAHIHLDYVGHAAITDRLLAVDPAWNWEPVAVDANGAPLVQTRGNLSLMWIKLTVCGTTRLGVGTCESRKFEIEKELIGDALRNAAMRFGVGLDLWSKEQLGDGEEKPEGGEAKPLTAEEVEKFEADIHFAQTRAEIDAVALEMRERGVVGEDRERLGTIFKARRSEIVGAEEIPA